MNSTIYGIMHLNETPPKRQLRCSPLFIVAFHSTATTTTTRGDCGIIWFCQYALSFALFAVCLYCDAIQLYDLCFIQMLLCCQCMEINGVVGAWTHNYAFRRQLHTKHTRRWEFVDFDETGNIRKTKCKPNQIWLTKEKYTQRRENSTFVKYLGTKNEDRAKINTDTFKQSKKILGNACRFISVLIIIFSDIGPFHSLTGLFMERIKKIHNETK